MIYNLSQKLESISPKHPNFRRFFCTLHKVLRTYHQYVKFHTRKNRLDLCYGTIANAFSATARPPLGTLDHNVVYLRPTYYQLQEREKPTVKTVQIFKDNSITLLQGCFDCTVWEVFEDSSSDLDELRCRFRLCKCLC